MKPKPCDVCGDMTAGHLTVIRATMPDRDAHVRLCDRCLCELNPSEAARKGLYLNDLMEIETP